MSASPMLAHEDSAQRGSTAADGPHRGSVTTPAYLTPEDVAQLLQVSVKTVSRWTLEDPTMPVLKRGRVVRFERDRLMAWLARQEPRAAKRSRHGAPVAQAATPSRKPQRHQALAETSA